MEILYRDNSIVVCIKPAGVLSTDEEGGMPSLLRAELGTDCVRSVHRLDRVVSGVMVYALTPQSASELSRQIREDGFGKEYLAVIHWRPREPVGTFRDLLARDPVERKTYVAKEPGKDVREAILDYETLASAQGMSLMRITLRTGRTHQIRAQFSAAGHPLLGDGKYGKGNDPHNMGEKHQALYSYKLKFTFETPAGALEYLNGKEFSVEKVDFAEKYFDFTL